IGLHRAGRGRHVEAFSSPSWKARRDRGASRRCFLSMKTIRQSQLARAWSRRARVGDIVIFDVLGAAPRGSGATEAAAREDVRRIAESLRAPHEDCNGEAVPDVRAKVRSDDDEFRRVAEIERAANGKPSYLEMDAAFRARMHAAIATGLERQSASSLRLELKNLDTSRP